MDRRPNIGSYSCANPKDGPASEDRGKAPQGFGTNGLSLVPKLVQSSPVTSITGNEPVVVEAVPTHVQFSHESIEPRNVSNLGPGNSRSLLAKNVNKILMYEQRATLFKG